MICSWCWFIHPATAISTNRNGSRTLGIVSSLSRDLRAAVTLFHADPVSGPYAVLFLGILPLPLHLPLGVLLLPLQLLFGRLLLPLQLLLPSSVQPFKFPAQPLHLLPLGLCR